MREAGTARPRRPAISARSRPYRVRRPGPDGLSLPVLAAIATAVGGALVLTATVLPLLLSGEAGRPVRVGIFSGLLAGAVTATAAGVAARRLAAALRLLRAEAVSRLRDPGTPLRSTSADQLTLGTTVELVELARTLDALHRRVRMADEVAGRHRRTAETASAGMFELLSGLVAAEEGARGQLSAELHDTAAQSLMLARSLLAAPGAAADVARAADLVAEAEDQVRAVMARTRPPALQDGDLASAVRSLRDDLEQRYGLAVSVIWPREPAPLPLVSAITIYRFYQEALLNVVKHADGDNARVTLAVNETGIVATVSDEGPGFDPAEVRPDRGRHVGLGLLRERARLAGGALEIASEPGGGTVLALRLPRRNPTGVRDRTGFTGPSRPDVQRLPRGGRVATPGGGNPAAVPRTSHHAAR